MGYAGKIEDLIGERDAANSAMHSALRLVADLRWALGDDGGRMQPELLEYAKQMRKDAERWRWWRQKHQALCSFHCAVQAGLDLRLVYVNMPEKMDEVTDAAMAAAPKPVSA